MPFTESTRTTTTLAALISLGVVLGTSVAAADTGSVSGSAGSAAVGSFAPPDPVSTLPAPAVTTLRLTGAENFRDIGGYRTTDGHTVRAGLVYRSNSLAGLTDADLATLTAANLTLDVDLRNSAERAAAPDRIPAGTRYQVADVVGTDNGVYFHDFPVITLGAAIIDGIFSATSNMGQSIGYPFMVDYHGSDVAFAALLTGIAQNSTGATVYHCTAGKDRTGWATAVLLTLLGVPRDVVNADYLASNTELGNPNAVQLPWLEAAFNEVDQLYGSFDNYVRTGLGLSQATIDALRTKLLV